MAELNVYLSSPYLEFKNTRQNFLDKIQGRRYLYKITAMEDYRAEDRNVLYKCIEDVKKCNIYVCIIGEGYGSIARDLEGKDTGKSFTYWEYHTACQRKAQGEDIERLILIKSIPPEKELDPLLKQWKQEIASSQLQTIYFNELDEIPQKIIESLDNFVSKRLQASMQKKDVMQDKIYLCNRSKQNQEFGASIDDDPVQFFLLNGHDKDLPHYFIKRQELEFEDRSLQWTNINIKPAIPNDVKEFDKVELYIKAEILSKLKWRKFKLAKDVTINGLIDYMTETQIDYLSISWFIESTYWKNDKLKEFIVSFYKKYKELNQNLVTDKRIIFFGILKYVDNQEITEQEFNNRVSSILWEHNLSRFEKLNRQDIKDWLCDSEIEEMDSRGDELVSLYVKDIVEKDLYFSEVETGLMHIIKLYNQQPT
ncbi:MAG: DUF4062 domain-containing protein [Bacteroidota bacterium]|nr:DUF4062 domain-containing protein [Bacteroidota bacterium]